MSEDVPQSAADPRPDGEPYYIDSRCECGEELILYDELPGDDRRASDAFVDPELEPSEVVWHDEWACPNCLDGIHMDWPEEHAEYWNRIANEVSQQFEVAE